LFCASQVYEELLGVKACCRPELLHISMSCQHYSLLPVEDVVRVEPLVEWCSALDFHDLFIYYSNLMLILVLTNNFYRKHTF
jgi:hypothetical protein